MKQTLLQLLLLLTFGLSTFTVSATHNRAGEIRVEQIGDDCNSLTIRATVAIYTKTSSSQADRDTIEICWGDGTGDAFCQNIPRVNGTGEVLQNDIKKNLYVGIHTYAGRGRYTISVMDPNRIAGIANINNGQSVMVPFYIQTVYTFLDPQFQGCNSTPELLQPPVDIGCVGKEFRHNPTAFDPDGDSLAYKLVVPLQSATEPVPNYRFPQQVVPGGFLDLNEVTGSLIWNAPQRAGDYNIAILIVEYREGFPIDSTIRDLQVEITECENLPPDIQVAPEICVIAGQSIEFDVDATAPTSESRQKVAIVGFGKPFEIRDSAVFDIAPGFQDQTLTGKFRWDTKCEHIAQYPYKVTFRAEDDFPIIKVENGVRDTNYLSTLETVSIKVVGPAPEDLQAEAFPGEVKLNWLSPYTCEDAREDYFFGFSVYRRLGSNQFPPDDCRPGMDGRGYQEIAFRTQMLDNGRYSYSDLNVERGRTYCYRIIARFAKYTTNGQPYNLVDGLPSDEICIQLSRDIPLITNVSVEETNATNGQMLVQWSKPQGKDLDTLLNQPPYRYRVLRAPGITDTGFQPVAGGDFIANTFAEANDTTFIDSIGLNTVDGPFSYKVEFYVNNEPEPLGDTENASSVFLNVFETDERNELSWVFGVPWENITYTIYRDDDADGIFDSLTTTRDTVFIDEGLINGEEYCYYVESAGSYGVTGVLEPLLNKSQQKCGIPIDNVPPCPPPLAIANICDPDPLQETIDRIENLLTWPNPEDICDDTDDVLGYRIYYAIDSLSTLELIDEIEDEDDLMYYHSSSFGLAGCYAITAYDSLNNESIFSNVVCKDNCPSYELPNAFTPNGDSRNDIFKPYPFRFIASIDMQILNRWGNVVFETTDPNINWDGTSPGGEELPDGVYFYKCQIFEQRLEGVVPSDMALSGYIELIREAK